MKYVKKLIVFLLIAAMVLPMVSDFSILTNIVSTKVYAADTDDDDKAQNPGSGKTKSNYTFAMLPDTKIYDYDKELFIADLKPGQYNVDMTIDKLGKKDYPYVIMELVPDHTGSRLRMHLADQGFYDLTAEEVAAIQLTGSEKTTIRVNALEYFFYKNEQILIDESLKKANAEIKAKKEKLDSEKQKLSELESALVPFRNQYDVLKTYLDGLNNGYGTVDSIIGILDMNDFKFSEDETEDTNIKNTLTVNFDGLKNKYTEYEALVVERTKLEEELTALINELSQLNNGLAQLQSQKAELESQKKQSEDDKKALEERYSNGDKWTSGHVGYDIDVTEKALKSVNDQIAAIEIANDDCAKIIEEYFNDLTTRAENHKDFAGWNYSPIIYQLIIEDGNEAIGSEWDYQNLAQATQHLLKTVYVKNKVAELYADVNSELSRQTEVLRSQRAELEGQLKVYQDEKDALPGNIEALDKQIKGLSDKIADIEKEIAKETNGVIKDKNTEIANKQNAVNQKKDEITQKIRDMHSDLQKITDAAKTPYDNKQNEVNTQKQKVAELEKELRKLLKIPSVATELNNARAKDRANGGGNYTELSKEQIDKTEFGKKIIELENVLWGTAEDASYASLGLEKKAYVTKETYDNYINNKEDVALQYKISARKTERYTLVENGMSVHFPFKYTTQYAVKDGKFVINEQGVSGGFFTKADVHNGTVMGYLKKTVSNPEGTVETNALRGEYALTQTQYNPMAIGANALYGFNDGVKLLEPKYIFEKSCFALGYQTNTENNQAGAKIISQTPYVDEYIFAGWSIPVTTDGKTELVSIESTESDEFKKAHPDFKFSEVKDLYTNWSVRYYEENEYKLLQTKYGVNNGENCAVQIGKYTVHLPECVASNHSEGIHDSKNQLSFCTPETTKALIITDSVNYSEEDISYVNETSAWYFSFDDVLSVDKLKQVAPKLMADTDYYVRTYDQEVDANGNVTYYPYNVVTITVTPTDLNKMVYDTAYAGQNLENAPYRESDYLNQFLDNVDLFVLMKGGDAKYFKGDNCNTITEHDFEYMASNKTLKIAPNKYMIPTLFHKEGNDVVYDYVAKDANGNIIKDANGNVVNNLPDNSKFALNFWDDGCPDLEWQVVDKMYRRIMDTSQVRRAALITDESATDKIHAFMGTAKAVPEHGKTTAVGDSGGTEYNLSKFVHMVYGFADPTLFFDFYMNQSFTRYSFDKVKGTHRMNDNGNVYKDTYFTGLLYNSSIWNTALFFPYELLGEDHISVIRNYGNIWDRYLSINLFASVGLVRDAQYKNVTNEFAYTFNGDTNLDQSFYDHNIDEKVASTNAFPNTKRAFDYFRGIGNRLTEIKNGKIATKSAIEFMIQSVRNGTLSSKERYIDILNAMQKGKRFDTKTGKIVVSTVPVDDIGASMSEVEYRFHGASTVTGYFVAQYLWTNEYSDVDEDCRVGKLFYTAHTKYPDSDPTKWFRVPESYKNGVLTGDKEGAFITKKIEYQGENSEGGSLPVQTIKDYVENNPGGDSKVILKYDGVNDYMFDALVQPKLRKESDKPTYIIAVLQFADAEAYRQYLSNPTQYEDNLLSVTLKNVTLDKMSYIFNLD